MHPRSVAAVVAVVAEVSAAVAPESIEAAAALALSAVRAAVWHGYRPAVLPCAARWAVAPQ